MQTELNTRYPYSSFLVYCYVNIMYLFSTIINLEQSSKHSEQM